MSLPTDTSRESHGVESRRREITDTILREAVAGALDKRARASGNIIGWTGRAADACDVCPRTVEKWRFNEQAFAPEKLLLMFEHFGTGFVNEIFALGSYTAARRHDEAIDAINTLADYKTAFTQIRGVMDDAEAASTGGLRAGEG